MSHQKHGGQNITTGDIKKSAGVIIGRDISASVSVNPTPSPTREELIALFDSFIQSLGSYENTLPDSPAIREAAETARAEAESPSPRWAVIRRLLKGIAASVVSVAALTDAINNLESLVSHIAR